jgi:hypothetical protein
VGALQFVERPPDDQGEERDGAVRFGFTIGRRSVGELGFRAKRLRAARELRQR